VEREYGVKRSALMSKMKQLRLFAGTDLRELSGSALKAKVMALPLTPPGKVPLLLADENAMLVATWGLCDTAGNGKTRRQLSADGRRMLAEIALDPNLPASRRKRLSEAKCGKNWRRASLKRAGKKDPNLQLTFNKQSDLSQKRAAVTSPYLNSEMFGKIRKMYAGHHECGVLSTPEPRADQIWTGGEIGFDPKGVGRSDATEISGRDDATLMARDHRRESTILGDCLVLVARRRTMLHTTLRCPRGVEAARVPCSEPSIGLAYSRDAVRIHGPRRLFQSRAPLQGAVRPLAAPLLLLGRPRLALRRRCA